MSHTHKIETLKLQCYSGPGNSSYWTATFPNPNDPSILVHVFGRDPFDAIIKAARNFPGSFPALTLPVRLHGNN